jgi:Ni/Fe-hydrogenase subunit HybB-like protein
VINYWQRGVPVWEAPYFTRPFVALCAIAGVGLALAALRIVSPLGHFSGMNDFYAWGVWKTFNVMALTAFGSAGFAVGVAAWVLGHHRLHAVMRTAMLVSLVFYGTGLVALAVDVGRVWNFYNILLPWRWNGESAMFEVAICMPTYAFVFLAFENVPYVLERFWVTGRPAARRWIAAVEPFLRRIYPFMVAGAYVLPAAHQSSLGGLMSLAGWKVHPLWQTPWLPVLYLGQAFVCGFAAIIFTLMTACLYWRRPIDVSVLSELADLLSKTILLWVAFRLAEVAWRHQVPAVLRFDSYSLLFLAENAGLLVPALVFRSRRLRETPRVLYNMATLAGLASLLYRFSPTTLAYRPGGPQAVYFPTIPELLIMLGWIAIAIIVFSLAVKTFAILPAPIEAWDRMIAAARAEHPEWRLDAHGNPIDD